MKRNYPLAMFAILTLAGAFAWNSTRANDEDSLAEPNRSTETTVVSDLIDRIAALEKRIQTLEERETLVRQADTRDENMIDLPKLLPRSPQSVPQQRTRRTPETNRDENEPDSDRQKTNGQSWRIRLLGHRD